MALIIVSNRVMVGGAGEPAQGGVAGTLLQTLKRLGGTWIGWSGDTTEADEPSVRHVTEDGVAYWLIDLTQQDYHEYYTGFANRALWPLMHYRLGLTTFSQEDFDGYLRVNRAFARQVMACAEPHDLIWVHDYHLMPLAGALAELGARQRTGYFHHIPWPPPAVFRSLPSAAMILRAMMQFDVIGLQTAQDAEHLGQCLRLELGAREFSGTRDKGRRRRARWYRLADRVVKVIVLPIGIDPEAFATIAGSTVVDPVVKEALDSIGKRRMIIGVDRLDYAKGVAQRMEAYAQFLSDHPSRRGTVEYVQITPLSRSDIPEYEAINQEVAETAGRINGAEGEPSWTPIRYLNSSYPRTVLAGLYNAASVALVTPMRDGMNLVAKEFIAAQNSHDPGVLVLSRFAGAAVQLRTALLVNPYDKSEVAGAIETAISMPLRERRRRWRAMQASVLAEDANWWADSFVAQLAASQSGT
jgi:trehalose 6-phosphate synthase